MANALYDKARNSFARGEIAWKVGGDTFRVFIVDSALYTPDLTTHQFLSSVPAGARAGDNGNTGYNQGGLLTVIDPVAGVCDANDITLLAVPAGAVYEYVLIYKQGTSDADSRLIALFDTATGIPITTTNYDVLITWNNGSNKIFKL